MFSHINTAHAESVSLQTDMSLRVIANLELVHKHAEWMVCQLAPPARSGFHYGVDFPDTVKDFGQANQFSETQLCRGPFGTDSTYCATILK